MATLKGPCSLSAAIMSVSAVILAELTYAQLETFAVMGELEVKKQLPFCGQVKISYTCRKFMHYKIYLKCRARRVWIISGRFYASNFLKVAPRIRIKTTFASVPGARSQLLLTNNNSN